VKGPNRSIRPEALRFGNDLRFFPVITWIGMSGHLSTGIPACGK